MAFLAGYQRRKKVTIDNANVDSALTDCPVFIPVGVDNDIQADIDSGGENIRFTAADGETLLKYERKHFNPFPGNPIGKFYVKVPTVSAVADTEIYLYYKAASPSDGADPTNVWDADFEAVYHFEETPSGSGSVLDSTANANHGTPSGGPTLDGPGPAGDYYIFDGTDDGITTTCASTLGDFTAEVLVRFSSDPGSSVRLLDKNYAEGFWLGRSVADAGKFGGGVMETSPPYGRYVDLSADAWHHLASRRSGTTHAIIGDGGAVSVSGTVSGSALSSHAMIIGQEISGSNSWAGLIDEVRFSSVARSAAWLKFTSFNLLESDHEISFGAEEVDGGEATLAQSAYRFRDDDGDEDAASWLAAENTPATVPALTPFRLRKQLNAAGDLASSQFKVQYRRVGDSTWRDVGVP